MKKLFLTGWCLSCLLAQGQDFPRTDFNLEKLADEIFPLQELDLNYEELYENLAQLLARPLDLNSISREQMRSLFVVNEEEINAFMKFRENLGPLLSVYELQSIQAWSRTTFDKIIPFVTVVDSQSKLNASLLQRIADEGNSYLLLRAERSIETRAGFKPDVDSAQRYLGSPERLYLRYRVARVNDFSLGFTAEKDSGEPMRWSPAEKQYGFDYVSFHAQVLNKGKLKNLILGDFQTQFGQGLILGSSFGFGKNSETITTVRRSTLGFLPYTSLNENLFFRGAAGTFGLTKNIFIHGFASNTFRDGFLGAADESSFITSFSTSGLHRTQKEIQNRKQIGESDLGGVFQFKNRNLDAGITYYQTDFTKPLLTSPNPYNHFAFKGSHNLNTGLYLNYSFANFTFFTEFAQTWQHGNALTAGLLGSLTRKAEIALLYRNFSKDFYSFTANAFSENTQPQNEVGFYWGWKYIFNKRYSVSGYTDLFRFPWLRYRGYAPSEGSEWLLRFNYSPSRDVTFFVQAREESKIRNLSEDTNLYQYVTGIKRNYWVNCDYTVSRQLTFKTRVQGSTYDLGGKTTLGFALVQDLNITWNRWAFSMRYALFDTDDYDNRLYLYERDVWLAYSFPAYEGTGIRNYVLAQYKLSQNVDLWFRWSHVRYEERVEIGSGSDAIEGNTRNDVKFQARIRF